MRCALNDRVGLAICTTKNVSHRLIVEGDALGCQFAALIDWGAKGPRVINDSSTKRTGIALRLSHDAYHIPNGRVDMHDVRTGGARYCRPFGSFVCSGLLVLRYSWPWMSVSI